MIRILMLLVVTSVNAASIFNLNEKQTIETYLSNRDFNRIAIEKDRISQMFFDRDAFIVVNDAVNGQIFVKPTNKSSKYPLSFTITTEKNKTQDWLFTFKNVKARTLILSKGDNTVVRSVDCKQQTVDLLNKLMDGKKLKKMIVKNKSVAVTKGWKLTRLKHINAGNLIGHVLSLKNISNKSRDIKISELWRNSILAININRQTIQPGGHTLVFMVTDERGLD